MNAVRLLALVLLIVIIIVCLLFFLHVIGFEEAAVLELGAIGVWFTGSAVIV